jgi:type IV pilus assembly protein PilO
VAIQVEGKYRDIVTFFNNVSKMPRIVNILDISTGTPKKDPAGGTMVATSCKAVTYKFIETLKAEPSGASSDKGGKK